MDQKHEIFIYPRKKAEIFLLKLLELRVIFIGIISRWFFVRKKVSEEKKKRKSSALSQRNKKSLTSDLLSISWIETEFVLRLSSLLIFL